MAIFKKKTKAVKKAPVKKLKKTPPVEKTEKKLPIKKAMLKHKPPFMYYAIMQDQVPC